ncbi:MAG: hypothetical protein AAGC60_16005 [Acidobacteriota bacterium]
MSFYPEEVAAPFGPGGHLAPAGSADDSLTRRIAGYKRTVAARYRSIAPDEVDRALPRATLLVSPKIDGQFWCLVAEPASGDRPATVALVAPNGRVVGGDVPVLAEARARLVPKIAQRTILAGELFALRKSGRPRVGDVTGALGGGADAEVARLGFFAFDLLEGGDAQAVQEAKEEQGEASNGADGAPADGAAAGEYPRRLEVLQRLLDGGKRVQGIKTERVDGPEGVHRLFAEWVEGGKGEGLVVRTLDERVHKLKPIFTLDAVVIGYTEQTDAADHVRSMLLALRREDGRYQLVGSVGNLGEDARRAALHATLAPTVVESSYRFASSTGALFRFVEPRLVVEVKVTDLQVEDGSGRPVRRMVLDHQGAGDAAGWTPMQMLPGVSMIHPILVRLRDDKEASELDVRLAQVFERVEIADSERTVQRIERPRSELLRRAVFAKTTKSRKTGEEQTAVRKLLVWKTNKEQVDDDFPAFVVHWTDYSPGRKEPLQREVRLAPDRETADAIAEQMLADGVKRGWNEVGEPADDA